MISVLGPVFNNEEIMKMKIMYSGPEWLSLGKYVHDM